MLRVGLRCRIILSTYRNAALLPAFATNKLLSVPKPMRSGWYLIGNVSIRKSTGIVTLTSTGTGQGEKGINQKFAQILQCGISGGSPHVVGLHGSYTPGEMPTDDDCLSIAQAFAKPWKQLAIKYQGRLEEATKEEFEAVKKEIGTNGYDKWGPGGQYVRGWWRTKKEWADAFNLFLSEHEEGNDELKGYSITKLKTFIENWLRAHSDMEVDNDVSLGIYYFGESKDVESRMKRASDGNKMDGAKLQWLFCKFIGRGKPDVWMKIGEFGGSKARSHVLEASNLIVVGGYTSTSRAYGYLYTRQMRMHDGSGLNDLNGGASVRRVNTS